MMLQRLATGATGVKQARYRRRPTRGSEALARACAVYTHNASVMYVLLNVRPAYEFRRGFCTSVLFILCVCVSVYPSVPALAASASVETSKQRYSRVSLRLFLD